MGVFSIRARWASKICMLTFIAGTALMLEYRNDVPDWVTDEEGKAMQKRMWDALAEVLESVEPGCVEAMLRQ